MLLLEDAIAQAAAVGIRGMVRALTAVRLDGELPVDGSGPRVYVANHRSHADFLLIWAALPPEWRARVRPVAAADYWHASRLRRFVIDRVFRGVVIDRERRSDRPDPIAQMVAALDQGDDLIVFPEGTRNLGSAPLLPLKSGIYRLACERPDTAFVPVWIDNVAQLLPKGELIPVPSLCRVRVSPAFQLSPGESQTTFMDCTRAALLRMASPNANSQEEVPSCSNPQT